MPLEFQNGRFTSPDSLTSIYCQASLRNLFLVNYEADSLTETVFNFYCLDQDVIWSDSGHLVSWDQVVVGRKRKRQ